MDLMGNPWDEHAEAYGRFVSQREQADPERDPLLMATLALLGDVVGREVLDACCGEGFLSRILAARGARVTGIDLSPRLIAMARTKDRQGTIDYREGDLSRPLPEFEGRFDRIGSYLALNDVRDLRGFATTLASLAAPGARLVFAFNNPYSSVVRGHITNYFESGAFGVYGGLREMGITAPYYHRTLEEYLDAFLAEGLRLVKLVDVPDRANYAPILPEGCRFPRFMILAFDRA
jgi:SAM-dependent methyltransferase